MKNKGVTKIIFLNKHTKGKSKDEIIEGFKNIKLDDLFIKQLIEFKNGSSNFSYTS